jgi:hypothetical protein
MSRKVKLSARFFVLYGARWIKDLKPRTKVRRYLGVGEVYILPGAVNDVVLREKIDVAKAIKFSAAALNMPELCSPIVAVASCMRDR